MVRVAHVGDAPRNWHLACEDGELVLRHPEHRSFALREQDVHKRIEGARFSALARACAANRRPSILDGLGGWGLDAIALGSLGCQVTLIEFNPMVCVLARNLIYEQGLSVPVLCADVGDYLETSKESFDVVYLDPIFPPHPTNALPVRRMQMLESLAKADTDLHAVFELALDRSLGRVVVKHRRKQPSLFRKPDWQVQGRTIRFDVYRCSS